MAFMKPPPVLDRRDWPDFDRGPTHRLDRNHYICNCGAPFAIRRQPNSTALGQPRCCKPILSKAWNPPQACDSADGVQPLAPIDKDLANVHTLDLANMECRAPDINSAALDVLPESLSEFGMATLGACDDCLTTPTLWRSRGRDDIIMALSVAL
ncbi:uncharacterized protein LY79DRAFT_135359 [Colletotrichum navitas]|uniref:Uncharacterized protein n=1 Tax=Colletotrichum navitas TaxID=681940 RepID=A0AAD8V7P4_9PEZI|nr:uncharacterized protein LY79DRAFT_135359 [Colletotrichum navitas]KAK1594635.1 hypothetical protein LY79DRAFT_135359 [Colletotrichum navitas]